MPFTRLAVLLPAAAAIGLVAGPARGQMSRAEPAPMPRGAPETPKQDGGDPCPSNPSAASPPAQRIKVIIPPPEIVYREVGKKHGLLFGLCKPGAEPCVVAAPSAPPGGGTVSFNMNLAVPYTMNAAGTGGNLLAGLNGLGGLNRTRCSCAPS